MMRDGTRSVHRALRQSRPFAAWTVPGRLEYAYAALTGDDMTPPALHAVAAPLFAPRPTYAYMACAGSVTSKHPTATHAPLPQPDLDLGDARIPKGYAQALRGPHGEYWQEAIHKEWTGLMANDTMEFVLRSTMPPGANLMNCHYVFDLKTDKAGAVTAHKVCGRRR